LFSREPQSLRAYLSPKRRRHPALADEPPPPGPTGCSHRFEPLGERLEGGNRLDGLGAFLAGQCDRLVGSLTLGGQIGDVLGVARFGGR
jgi:hypothetical protein